MSRMIFVLLGIGLLISVISAQDTVEDETLHTILGEKPEHITCSENQEWDGCGTACPATCSNRDAPTRACTKQCVRGCKCKPDFLLNFSGGCVPPSEC